ncbi:hypothetical protein BHE90_002626 [Fusarium euwallaceae]|uniref:Uncharacterized protein n=1 Tax=Fusarium euwallaceae TaxID=1147111 RepID=A0A430M4G6_9HYPO|nr:hypothetical protein BHE90_002626 [Fusarium euwallaceae]
MRNCNMESYFTKFYKRSPESRKNIDSVCLDMEHLIEDDSKPRGRYGDARGDIVCYAYLEKQEESILPIEPLS